MSGIVMALKVIWLLRFDRPLRAARLSAM